jgi:predicted lipoprotein with Yx(FWY)xxD motif
MTAQINDDVERMTQQASPREPQKKSARLSRRPTPWSEVKSEDDLQRKAMHDAWVIMGRTDRWPGRGKPLYKWRADEDPLAWWLLTELLMGYAKAGQRLPMLSEQ